LWEFGTKRFRYRTKLETVISYKDSWPLKETANLSKVIQSRHRSAPGLDLRLSHTAEACGSDSHERPDKTSEYFDLNVYIAVNFAVMQVKKSIEFQDPSHLAWYVKC
jgi:hypothetical protein